MSSNLDRYRADLKALIDLGDRMFLDLFLEPQEEKRKLTPQETAQSKEVRGVFGKEYQRWYTESSAVIRQLIPDRLAEFEQLYKGDGKRKAINATTFTIQDWANGVRASADPLTGEKHFDDYAAVAMRFQTQLSILKASERRFQSSLLDIRQIVSADLLDSELNAARELFET